MQYRSLGDGALTVSEVCLGTMTFGQQNSRAEAHSQLDRAYRSFQDGGFFGLGPGEGRIKTVLPDAHTDFPFAVVAEEFGAIACLAIVALFAVVVLRPLARAAIARDPFIRHATTGLATMVGLQALINMGVNVGLAPAKGMTLPFISAGGSSMIAIAITCGMLIAVTRRRPGAMRPILSQFEPDAARDHAAAPVPNEAARSAYPLQSRS